MDIETFESGLRALFDFDPKVALLLSKFYAVIEAGRGDSQEDVADEEMRLMFFVGTVIHHRKGASIDHIIDFADESYREVYGDIGDLN